MLGNVAVNEAALRSFIETQQLKYERDTGNQRAAGHRHKHVPRMYEGWFEGQRAIVRFQMNNELGRMDIFYGGTGYNPLENKDHGHVIVRDKVIIEWLLPGSGDQRKRVI